MKHLAIGVFAAALVAALFGATTVTRETNQRAARSTEKAVHLAGLGAGQRWRLGTGRRRSRFRP
jgi:hypothetical protein